MKKLVFIMPLMAISLLASCGGSKPEAIYHYVTFVTNGGSTIEQAKVEDNKALKKPTDPTKTGFAFDVWCTDEGLTNEYDFSHLVTEDFTLYAKWNTEYTITYHNVTDSEHSNPKHYTEKDEITLSEASKDYYDFKGWFTDSALKTPITKITKGTTGNLDIYAKFEAIKYTITYNYDGGAGATTPNSYTFETPTVTLPTPTTMKTGYDGFDGWYFDKELTQPAGTGWSAGEQTGNKTLYAKYKNPTTYTISYPNVTDTEHSDPKQYTIETPTITLSKASRANYNFIGWFTDEACSKGNEIAEIKKGSTGSLVIYAKFEPIKYDIEYVLNDGTNDPRNPTDYTIESTVTLYPATHQTLVFGGWCLKQDLSDNPITGWNPGDKTGKVTLYAKWVSGYTITYKNVTSEETSGFTVKYTSKDLPLTLPKPTRDDWSFNGYYTDKTFNENSKLSGTDKNIIPVGTTGNLVLYAKMIINKTLDECSWDEINLASQSGTAPNSFGYPGAQTKKVQLKPQDKNEDGTDVISEGEIYQTVRIIDYNHDDLADGSGKVGITFEFANVITKANGSEPYTTIWDGIYFDYGENFDYRQSVLNNFLNDETKNVESVINMLPDDLNKEGIIKSVDKKVGVSETQQVGVEYFKATSFDGDTCPYPKLFPLAYDEIHSHEETPKHVTPGEDGGAGIYKYYESHSGDTDDDNAYRTKDIVGGSSGVDYWFRSPNADNATGAWRCKNNGRIMHVLICDYLLAVAPAFCI